MNSLDCVATAISQTWGVSHSWKKQPQKAEEGPGSGGPFPGILLAPWQAR